MPELPEVEVVKRSLERNILNLIIKNVKINDANLRYKVDKIGLSKLIGKKITKIKNNLKKDLPTIPTILEDELECNIFLKANDLKTFSKLRDLKDNF